MSTPAETYRIVYTTTSRSVAETIMDEIDAISLTPEPTADFQMPYRVSRQADLTERVYDALRAAGLKALADEFADANGASK